MGNFLGSTHVKIDSELELKSFLSELAAEDNFKCYVSPPTNGWVGIYRDEFGQIPLGESIAERFNNDIIDVMVHDDDVFCYQYFENGELMDTFNSCPDYFGEMNEDAGSSKGNPEVFKDLLDDPKKINALKDVLRQKTSVADISTDPKQVQDYFKRIEDLLNDPEKILQFAAENEIDLQGQIKALGDQLPDDQSPGAIVDLINQQPELLVETMKKIIALYAERQRDRFVPTNGTTVSQESKITPEDELKKNGYLFASMQLQDFAAIVGLPNVMTCYEYLTQGETDDIVNWNGFTKIPE